MLKLKLIVVHSSDSYKSILILPTFDVGLIRGVTKVVAGFRVFGVLTELGVFVQKW